MLKSKFPMSPQMQLELERSKMMFVLKNMHETLLGKIDAYFKEIETKRGDPGDPGEPGPEGPKWAKEDVSALIMEIMPELQETFGLVTESEVLDLVEPLIVSPMTKDEILGLVSPLIETPLSEKQIVALVKKYAPKVELETLIDLVLARLPSRGVEETPVLDPQTVIDQIKKEKLGLEHIDGLEEKLKEIKDQAGRTGRYLHGGGDTVQAGANITLTRTGDGKTVIASTGGSATGFQAATGTVDGSNTVFTFPVAPSAIIVDQGRPMQKVSSDGTVNWTGTTTVTLAVAPNFDIFAIG